MGVCESVFCMCVDDRDSVPHPVMVEGGVMLEHNMRGTLVLTARRFSHSCNFKTERDQSCSVLKLQLKKAILRQKCLAVRASVPRVLRSRITPPSTMCVDVCGINALIQFQ